MKTLLVAAIIISAAAGAYAFDLTALFGGSARPVVLKDLVSSTAVPAAVQSDKPGNCDFPVNIKPDEARYFIQVKHPIVIDIRRPEEYAAGHLKAVNMLMDYYAPDFKDQLAKLDRNAKYLIYCRTGHRTGITLLTMKDMGFTDIHDLDGGITAWVAAGFPVVTK